MRVSILSDEISVDPVAACELAASWGLRHLELRLWMNTRAPVGMSDADMWRVCAVAGDFGLDFPSISPGLFKLRLDSPEYQEHCGPFRERCFDLAEALGAPLVVLFPPLCASYEEWDSYPEHVVDDLRACAEAAAARNLVLALENEPACYGGSGQSLARLLAAVDHPNLRANWDPGNHTNATHEDYRAGYAAIRPYHVHTHVKDYDTATGGSAVPPGEGSVNWVGQLQALKDDGYEGLLVLETHFVPKIAGSGRCVEGLRNLLARIGEEAE
jgi:sugar phosphate isomerase/epimerase